MAFARYDSTAVRDEPGASIALAIAPARTENGRALLMHSLDRRFRAAGRPYEAHIRSQEGWQVSGYAMLGTPVMRSGIAPSHAWAHTESASDTRDAWVLAFDHPTDTLAYRHGSDWRRAEVFTDTIAVNTTSGVVRRPYRFLRTEYGPVVTRLEDGRAVAVQIARMREGGALQQWYAMNRANSLDGFRAALAHTALVGLNTMYADSSGRIYYVHGNAVPRRAAGVDPSALLDGSSATSAWDGYHRLEELPELLDPASGWIQSAAGTPFLATASGYNLERARYPSYMAPDGDTPRALQARRLLATEQDWTIEELETAAFDTHVPIADAAIRRLVDEYEQRGAVDPWGVLPLDHAVHQLREWDRTGAVESTAMTLFTTWQERLRSRSSGQQEEWPLTNALAWALERLERRWDRQDVAWGRVNRLTFPGTPQDGDSTGVALPGGPAWSGSLFGAAPITAGYGGERTLVSGISWSSVMEPGARARSWSFVVTGQSGDPASPHSSDQVRLLTERRMKPAADSAGWLPLRPPPQ
jgi:penicillin amidase